MFGHNYVVSSMWLTLYLNAQQFTDSGIEKFSLGKFLLDNS